MITREFTMKLIERFSSPCEKIQVILGPRQIGKTTGVLEFANKVDRAIYFTADGILSGQSSWVESCFQQAIRESKILIIDEIQKIVNWSEIIKKIWDESKINKNGLECILLGSSSLEINRGLTESLLGRYELINVPHWSYSESKELSGLTVNEYLVYGGYPGSYEFIDDFDRWSHYLTTSIVDNVITKDILLYQTVRNVSLFKQAFDIISHYPSHEISYNKLLGQIQDKGNIDIVKHYLNLYQGAFLIDVLEKYSVKPIKRKTSSPKILHRCPAFYGRLLGKRIIDESQLKGHAFETLIGNILKNTFRKIYYWREGNYEVDFVFKYLGQEYGIEVKSGRRKSEKSKERFLKSFPEAKYFWIGTNDFESFERNPKEFLGI